MKVLLLDGKRHEKLDSGYGQFAAGIKQELEARGVEIEFDRRRPADVALYVCPPYSIHEDDLACPTAIFTMHELEHLPPGKEDWPAKLNRLDLVLTPTSWNRAVWRQVGVTIPVEVVPLGVDPTQFYPAWGQCCRFLTVHSGLGSRSSRENWWETLEAYYRTFSAADNVELIVKTWQWQEPAYTKEVSSVRSAAGRDETTAPKVTVIDRPLTGPELRDLYLGAWVVVKNANREGWGLPATEAVACGKRVIASEIQPLKSHLPAATTRWFTLGDVGELGFVLRDEQRSWQAAMAIAHRHTWANTGAWVHRWLTSLTK